MTVDDPSSREGPDRRETRASRRAHAPGRDPRDIVTEYAFQVDPDLLGVPLAGPFRRLSAVVVDLFVLALLFPIRAAAGSVAGGLVDLVVALAVAWVLFRLASPAAEGRTPSSWMRFLLRGVAVVVALVGVADVLGGGDGPDGDEGTPAEVRQAAGADTLPGLSGGEGVIEAGGRDISLGEVIGGARGFLELARADSPAAARPAAEDVARRLQDAGASSADIEDAIRQVLARDGEPEPWMEEVAASAAALADSLARLERRDADSLAVRYVRALEAGAGARADSLRPRLVDALAGDRIDRLEEDNRELEDRLEEATSTQGLVGRTMDVITEDLGIGLGWIGLYFTAFLALWRGRTPGKRLLGMRVVQLDGTRLGWWDAFGRFGGYAAGVATGMLGYLQIFWDPNRQALHDKVAGTVVIRTRGPGKPYRPREG